MRLSERFGLSERWLRKAALAVMVVYVIAIQLPLLSPYRLVPVDEMQLVDAAYGVSSGHSVVPAGWFWSHTIPETARYFEAFRPLYLYVLAAALRILGMSVISVGFLHFCLRLTASALFFVISRRITQNLFLSIWLSAIWATFAHGPIGRFEDLAIVLLLAVLHLVISAQGSNSKLILAGVFAGMAFLTYPGYLTLLPLLVIIIGLPLGAPFQVESRLILIRRTLLFLIAVACTTLLWLFWIIPYWHEFKVHFLEFAVPDALAPSYTKSLADLVRYVVGGFLTSPFPFHYSLLPVLGLLGTLIVLDSRRNGFSFRTVLAIALPLLIAALTARVRIHKTYNLIWFITTILVLLPILWGRAFDEQRRFASASLFARVIIGLLTIVIGFQLTAHLMLAGLGIVGDIAAVDACGTDPHAQFVNQIPPGDKVVTNSAEIFYSVRQRNPVYWPSGLQGETPGRVPFSTSYDDSFRWLALTRSLPEDNLIEKYNPGGKFRWDTKTLDYFRTHYALIETSDLTKECNLLRGLSRFSSMPRSLYLYQRK